MLQTDRARGPLGGAPSEGAEEGGIGQLLNFAQGFLRRQYVVIIFTSALALAMCVVYLRVTPPTYTGQVQVLLSNPKAQFVQQQSLLNEPVFDMNQIETQLQIIQSKAVAIAVIKQLKLVDDPDLKSSKPSLASIWHKIRGRFSQPPKEPRGDTADQLSEGLIGAFLDRLQARRLSFSNIIEISFNSSNAARAAEIANAVANTYINDQLNAKFEANRTATAWLQDRLHDLGDQASTARSAVSA